MSDSYGSGASGGSTAASTDESGTIGTAKREASNVAGAATEQAKDVAGTVKDEASSVAHEVKVQAKDLYAQTQREFKDQAASQQQRLASGLKAVGGELHSMAANSDGGVASDLVRQISVRVAGAATWLQDRDPSAVLAEVKRYARRKPGTFILAASIAGMAVGRLTRALAANASDEASHAAAAPPVPRRDAWAVAAETEDTPIFAQAAPTMTGDAARGAGDDRSDAL